MLIQKDDLTLHGSVVRGKDSLVDLEGTLRGSVEVECARCGKSFSVPIDEPLILKLSDGVYKGFDNEADIIEFYNGSVDMQELIDSEYESIRLDYHICNECKQKEGE